MVGPARTIRVLTHSAVTFKKSFRRDSSFNRILKPVNVGDHGNQTTVDLGSSGFLVFGPSGF